MLLPTVALSSVLGHLLMHAASLALEARSADAAGGRAGSGGSGGVAGGGSGGGGGGGGGGSGGGRGSGVFACGRRRDASRKASLASSLLENEGGRWRGHRLRTRAASSMHTSPPRLSTRRCATTAMREA